MVSDTALVHQALSGDASAFTALADRHTAACLRFAMQMLGDRADAEDATQEALLRAYRALDAFDGRVEFRTWLFAILVNRCRSMLQSRTRRQRRVSHDNDAVQRGAVQSHGPDTDLRFEIERALAHLPQEQREAFLLKHVEQLEYTEMARITGARVSALKMRVQRACTKLEQVLHEYRADYGAARTNGRGATKGGSSHVG